MLTSESLRLSGEVRVEVRRHGRLVRVDVVPNLIVDGFLEEVSKHERGVGVDLQISYVATGDSTTAVANGDTQLGNERFRKQATKQTDAGAGKTTTELFVGTGEANFQWEEIAFFCGSASATTNSGTMVARILYSHNKTSSETVTISRTSTVARG